MQSVRAEFSRALLEKTRFETSNAESRVVGQKMATESPPVVLRATTSGTRILLYVTRFVYFESHFVRPRWHDPVDVKAAPDRPLAAYPDQNAIACLPFGMPVAFC